MKKFIFGLLLFCAQSATAQRLPDVVGKRVLIRDSMKLRGKWYKDFANIATASLTANGSYVHDWAGYSTVLNNALSFGIYVNQYGIIASPGTGSTNSLSVGVDRSQNHAFVQSNRPGYNTLVSCKDGVITNVSNTIQFRVGNHFLQPAGSLLTLANPTTGEMQWLSSASLTQNSWQLFGNAGPYTTDMTLGTTNNYPFRIITNATDRMWFMPNGNIGVNTNSPDARFHINTGVAIAFKTVEANPSYTVMPNDYLLSVANGSQPAVIVLPTASGCTGRIVVVKRKDANSSASIMVMSLSGEIQNKRTGTFTSDYEMPDIGESIGVTFVSNGTDWEVF